MAASLSFDQAPPISVPARFFLTAPLFGVAAGLMLALNDGGLFDSRWQPAALALTHLMTLGFMLPTLCGALLQILPVAIGTNVWRPHAVAWISHVGLVAGTLLLVGGFLSGAPVLFRLGGPVLGATLAIYAAAVGVGVILSSARSPTIIALRLAIAALIVTAGLGVALATSRLEPGTGRRGGLSGGADVPAASTLQIRFRVLVAACPRRTLRRVDRSRVHGTGVDAGTARGVVLGWACSVIRPYDIVLAAQAPAQDSGQCSAILAHEHGGSHRGGRPRSGTTRDRHGRDGDKNGIPARHPDDRRRLHRTDQRHALQDRAVHHLASPAARPRRAAQYASDDSGTHDARPVPPVLVLPGAADRRGDRPSADAACRPVVRCVLPVAGIEPCPRLPALCAAQRWRRQSPAGGRSGLSLESRHARIDG